MPEIRVTIKSKRSKRFDINMEDDSDMLQPMSPQGITTLL